MNLLNFYIETVHAIFVKNDTIDVSCHSEHDRSNTKKENSHEREGIKFHEQKEIVAINLSFDKFSLQ